MESKNNPLGMEKPSQLLVKYAVPSVIAMLVGSLYNIVDQIFIGWGVGYLGNAATNVAYPFTTISLAVALLFGIGASAQYNLSLGSGNVEKAGKTVSIALSSLFFSSLILTFISEVFLVPLLTVFGSTDDVMPYALEYMRITILGFPALIVSHGMASVIRADGSPRYSMFSTLVGAVLNTILDPIFIFGFDMGMTGAALATVIGQYGSLIMVFAYFKHFRFIHFRFKVHFDADIFRRICTLGMSNSLNQVAITAVQIIMNNLFSIYGALSIYGSNIPLAASGIVMKVNSLMISVIAGISQGSQPILSYNYGSGKFQRVRKSFYSALKASFFISFLFFLSCQIFPRKIITVFGTGDEFYFEFAVRFMHLFMLFAPFNSVQILGSNFFSSIGKPGIGVFLSMSRQVIFLIPSLFLLSYFMGVDGLIWASPIADAIAFAISVVILSREMTLLKRKSVSS